MNQVGQGELRLRVHGVKDGAEIREAPQLSGNRSTEVIVCDVKAVAHIHHQPKLCWNPACRIESVSLRGKFQSFAVGYESAADWLQK